MEKLKMHSNDLVGQNVEKLMELFPNCVTEKKNENGELEKAVDFDLLRQELSNKIVEGPEERYQLNWPGKKEALLTANAPIAKTLRPCREESVDFDNTENLFIEGDNLDALKLLQETYLGKVKMIYIDPPYNTGNDFIYEDDFAESTDEFLKRSGQKDEEGNRMVANTESNGRYHSDWLSMMYSRIKLSKNLLKEDGVIFISIDDNEVHNLRKLLDEIYGTDNFLCSLIWRKKTGASDSKGFSIITENIFIYVKNKSKLENIFTRNYDSFDPKRYSLSDEFIEKRGKHYIDNLDRGGIQYSDSMNYPIECPDGSITYPNGRKEFVNDGWIWTWGKEKLKWGLLNGFIIFKKSKNKESGWGVYYKNYLFVNNKDELIKRSAPHKNLILDIINTAGTIEIGKLFGIKVFQYTKPTDLVSLLIKYVNFNHNDIILDFFAGSSTTAHAVMQQNSEDNDNRKFIMIQLPEPCDEKSEAYKAGYKNIAEISKERIRRAGKKILEEYEAKKEDSKQKTIFDKNESNTTNKLDIGFRVLKVDSSNMQDVFYTPDETEQRQLNFKTDNIKTDRSDEDLLFQVLLDWGVDLTLPIKKEKIENQDVFFVDNNALVACFTKKGDVTEELVKEIAKREPLRVVFRDAGFKDDSVKINVEQVFKLTSVHTEIKTI